MNALHTTISEHLEFSIAIFCSNAGAVPQSGISGVFKILFVKIFLNSILTMGPFFSTLNCFFFSVSVTGDFFNATVLTLNLGSTFP